MSQIYGVHLNPSSDPSKGYGMTEFKDDVQKPKKLRKEGHGVLGFRSSNGLLDLRPLEHHDVYPDFYNQENLQEFVSRLIHVFICEQVF